MGYSKHCMQNLFHRINKPGIKETAFHKLEKRVKKIKCKHTTYHNFGECQWQ